MTTKTTNAAAVLADRADKNAARLARIAAFTSDPANEAHLRALLGQTEDDPLQIVTTPERYFVRPFRGGFDTSVVRSNRGTRINRRRSALRVKPTVVTLSADDHTIIERHAALVVAATGARPSRSMTIATALALLDGAISVVAANDAEPLRDAHVSAA